MYILGISGYYHDSAAALICKDQIAAAAQEERFSRKKHDESFPKNAIEYCLNEANITLKDVSYIVFYDKPILKFSRLLETYLSVAPKGFKSFCKSMPIWLKDKLFLKRDIKKNLKKLLDNKKAKLPALLFCEHHQSHAASAYFPSSFDSANVLCIDAVGEWATTTFWRGKQNKLELVKSINFPHSLGMLYSAFTYYTGFKVNSGEYKIMGLAPYGEAKYVDLIYKHLIEVSDDGSFRLNMDYFDYCTGLTMTNEKFHNLFGAPPRAPESEVTQKEMDLARSIQVVTEDIVLKLVKSAREETSEKNLCLAGGVALNCVANGRILREAGYENIWIQPAAGDAGGALGAAYSVWYEYLDNLKNSNADKRDMMKGSYLGPSFSNDEIKTFLDRENLKYVEFDDETIFDEVSEYLDQGKVVGLFQGKMEFGPRALGNRSIIGDPRNTKMQTTMNLKIKYRESFRPFAPSVLEEDANDYFNIEDKSPYMLLVADVSEKMRLNDVDDDGLFGIEKLKVNRSKIPAVTHVDYSARVQTVSKETNPRYHKLISAFKKKTGSSVLVNTSFNVRGEPIVCTPMDALRCFMNTEMDYLVLENQILDKNALKHEVQRYKYSENFQLD